MNKFRKLIRITISVVVVVLILNCLGLYYISLKSDENEARENLEKLSESQQKISLSISKQLFVFASEIEDHPENTTIGKDLAGLLSKFKEQQSNIEKEIPEYSFSTDVLKIHFDAGTPYFTTINQIAYQILEKTSFSDKMHFDLIHDLSENQGLYQNKMELVTQNLRESEDQLSNSIYLMNLLILGSLVISLIILALMVISPVLKNGVKNFTELQVSLNDVRRSEDALQKKDRLLQGVAFATQELISNKDFHSAIGEAVKRFGNTILADEVSIQKNETDQYGVLYSKQFVCFKDIDENVDYYNPEYQHVPFDYMPWTVEELKEKRIFHSAVKDLKDSSRHWFEGKNILSIVTLPIFVSGQFWGFINIYDSKEVRMWQQTEVYILQSLATTLGAVIERNQLQESLLLAKEVAEASSKAKSEFMSNMSHELRTPMNGIIGFTDLILTTELKPHQKEYLNNVSKSGNNLLNLINDILDFSKIEAEKLQLDPMPFKLNELVEETAQMLSLKAVEKGLEIICMIDPSLPSEFMGDSARIRQILVNLVGNAIKFTKKGEVVLEVKVDGAVYLQNNSRYLNLNIIISDTGIGIPAEKLHHVFENFTQVDSSTTRKYGGTGLGLTISRGLAQLMSGSLDVHSTLGKGSSFILKLPLIVLNESPEVRFAVKPLLKHVLVIDDNFTNCTLMKGVFEHLKIPCTICFSGQEALDLMEKSRSGGQVYDLIITDHQMPGMDGITMVKTMKSQLNGGVAPFILMLSSLDQSLYQREAENIGIDKFLSKPVKIAQLSEIISKIFDKPVNVDTELSETIIPEMISSGGKIMIVEDEPMNMFLISAILKSMGISVIESVSGKHAMEMLEIYSPSMIFMDVNMPEVDGLDATRMIRRLNGPKSRIPIVALTADAMKEDKQRCLDSGMNDYISKPFRREEIDLALDKYYDRTQQRA